MTKLPGLPETRHHVSVWVCIAAIGIFGTYAAALAFVLGLLVIGIFLALSIPVLIGVAVFFRQHNHDHLGLLIIAAVTSLLLAVWMSSLLLA